MSRLSCATAILFALLCSTVPASGSVGQIRTSIHSENTHERSNLGTVKNNKEGFLSNIGRNCKLVARGSAGIVSNLQKSLFLWQLERKEGTAALSFTDFQFLEQTKADLQKTAKLAVTIPLSPQYFFYSYLVFPLLSSNNPWAWRALPSTFDSADLKEARDRALTERRMQTVVSGLHTLLGEAVASAGCKPVREGKLRAVGRIRDALEQRNMSASLDALGPWLQSRGERAARGLQVSGVPGSVVRQCVRAVGGDGVPNIPIVRGLNHWQLNGRIKKVRKSDEFLLEKGVAALSPAEVSAACFERCISTEGRSATALRADLAEWLALSDPPTAQPGSVDRAGREAAATATTTATVAPEDHPGKGDSKEHSGIPNNRAGRARWAWAAPMTVPNPQNRRLAMMALHTVRGLRSSGFGAAYRALLQHSTTAE